MLTGDGWLLRVRLPGGVLSPGAMRVVAAVAAACGSGAVELTSRANLQVRGVTDLDGAARRLIEHGLALDDPQRDALRAVVASPSSMRRRAAPSSSPRGPTSSYGV